MRLCGSGQMATATGNRRRWPAQAAHPGPPNSSPPPCQTSCSATAMRARSPAGPGKKAHSDRAPEAALGRAGSSGRRSISLGGRDGQAARLAMPAIARRPRLPRAFTWPGRPPPSREVEESQAGEGTWFKLVAGEQRARAPGG